MSKEAILKIQETEEQAEQIRMDARLRAQQMVEEAQCKGQALCEKTEKETTAQVFAMMSAVDKKIIAITELAHREIAKTTDQIQTEAAFRQKKAESIVIERFKAKCR